MGQQKNLDGRDWIAIGLLSTPLIAILTASAGWRQVIAWRDGSHYYWPLYDWLAKQQRSGEWPLWNPLENAGVSLATDPTAALWYPLKLLLLVPLPDATAYNLYLIVHALIGLTGVVAWLRAPAANSSVIDPSVAERHFAQTNAKMRPRLSRAAAYLAAITYVYGGPFLIQYSNVIYLIGAAWLPWACYAIERLQQSRSLKPIVHLAVILALMTLGGDPQMSYHVGIIALLRILVGARSGARVVAEQKVQLTRGVQLQRLACAGALAIGLGAIQILPTWHAVKQSGRTRQAPTPTAASLDLAHTTHENARYEFSVGPWQWAEIVWPNVGGRLFPQHQRWWSALPADGRVWCPSLFMGVLPAALMLSCFSFTTKCPRIRWLTALFVLALGAASGWYGGGWLAREIGRACGWPAAFSNLPPEFGSPYWLFVKLLPGYASFRYPGKWLVVANLALAVLAAHGWDQIRAAISSMRLSLQTRPINEPSDCNQWIDESLSDSRKQVRRWQRVLLALGLLTAILGAGQLAVQWLGWWQVWLDQAPADPWLGPLHRHGAARDITIAWIQTSSVLALAWWSTRVVVRANSVSTDRVTQPRRFTSLYALTQRHAATGWLLVVLLDLGSANHWLVQLLPVETTAAHSPAIVEDSTAVASHNARVWRADWVDWQPPEWALESNTQRLRETQIWEQATEFPKWNLQTGRGVVSREESLLREDWLVYWALAAEQGLRRPDGSLEPRIELLRLLAINELLLPAGTRIPHEWQTHLENISSRYPEPVTSNLDRYRLIRPLPRAWLVNRVLTLPSLPANHESACVEQTRKVLRAVESSASLPQLAIVETSDPSEVAALKQDATMNQNSDEQTPLMDRSLLPQQLDDDAREEPPARGAVRLLVDRPNHVQLEVVSPSPALCVLADRYDTDWQVDVRVANSSPATKSSPVLRANRLVRGVVVPAGKSTVSFHYRPWRVRWGAIVSAICGIVCGILLFTSRSPKESSTG